MGRAKPRPPERSPERGEPGPSITALDVPPASFRFHRMVGRDASIAVYIMASARNGTLYTGVTSALWARVQQHKLGVFEGFSKTYGCKALVWCETHASMLEAIEREKRIKRWRRRWKLELIEAENPQWRDLSEGWFEVAEGPLSWTQRS